MNKDDLSSGLHIGDIILEEFMIPLNINSQILSEMTGIDVNDIENILSGVSGLTELTSAKIGQQFKMSDGFFLRVQDNLNS